MEGYNGYDFKNAAGPRLLEGGSAVCGSVVSGPRVGNRGQCWASFDTLGVGVVEGWIATDGTAC